MMKFKVLSCSIMLIASQVCDAQHYWKGMGIERNSKEVCLVSNGLKVPVSENSITVKPWSIVPDLAKEFEVIRSNKLGYVDLRVPDGLKVEDYVTSLEESGLFEVVQYNTLAELFISPNDAFISNQYYLNTINVYNAWDITVGKQSVIAAVIDSEADRQHADLGYGSNWYTNYSTLLGWNYTENTNSPASPQFHGTSVSGIISAKTNNSLGIAGVSGGNYCPGVLLANYSVSTETGSNYINMGYVDDAIIKATDEGAKVINMSFGGLSEFVSSPDVDDAIEYAYNHGVTLVAASGNTSLFVGVTSNVYPASHPLVISAGSVDQSLSRSSFSVYGDSLDIVAPGRDIYSTTPNNNYGYNSGTSFSSPQVAAVAALLYSVKPDITPAEVKQALIETAYKIPSYAFDENGWNNEVGHGLLDAGAAVWSLIKISGSPVICSETIFTVENLPSGFNVVWELSDSFYETNCTLKGYPQNNMCTIQPHSTVAMEHGVLTAKLIHSGNIVKTLTKNVYVHIGFSGTYSYGSTTKPINLLTPLYTVPGSIVTVYCPNLRGMTLTHEAGVPTFWDYDEYNAILQVGIPSVGTTVVVVRAISESGCNNFVLPIIGTNNSSLLSGNFDMRMENGKITISFIPEEDDTVLHVLRKYCDLDYLEWTVEAYNVMSGEKMFMEKVTGPSYTFETYKWHSGVYAIRAIVGKEVMTNKIYIK